MNIPSREIQQPMLYLAIIDVAVIPRHHLSHQLMTSPLCPAGALVGAGDFRFMAGAMVAASLGAVSALLSVEPLGSGLQGVWVAQALLMAGRATTLGYRYSSEAGPLPPSACAIAQDHVGTVLDQWGHVRSSDDLLVSDSPQSLRKQLVEASKKDN